MRQVEKDLLERSKREKKCPPRVKQIERPTAEWAQVIGRVCQESVTSTLECFADLLSKNATKLGLSSDNHFTPILQEAINLLFPEARARLRRDLQDPWFESASQELDGSGALESLMSRIRLRDFDLEPQRDTADIRSPQVSQKPTISPVITQPSGSTIKRKVIGNKWTLGNKIGKGGQAMVFEATCAGDECVRAIKLIKTTDEKKRTRFVQEVRKHLELSQKQAPNIIPILDHNLNLFEKGDMQGYIVMPKAETTLEEQIPLLKGRTELCLEVLEGIISGIREAHSIGVIHRDLKPSNVLFLDKSLRNPLVTDFGICFIKDMLDEERVTSINETVGPRYFMAPEQETGKSENITEAADIYSLGKLLHYILTGRRFHREDLTRAFEESELNSDPRLKILLEKFLMHTVVLSPNERIQTADELLKVLGKVRDKQSASIQEPIKAEIGIGLPEALSQHLQNARTAYGKALECARQGDIVEWRKLFGQSKRSIPSELEKWRAKYEKRSLTKIDLPQLAREGVDIYAPMLGIALAGVVSSREKFNNQVAVLDEVRYPKAWNRTGLQVIVDLPETAAFVYQAVHGAVCLQTDQLTLAVNLARTRVEAGGDRLLPLFNVSEIIGWPASLGGNSKVAWEFLAKLFDQWTWLEEIFVDADEYHAALCAYYMALNILELADTISVGRKEIVTGDNIRLEVPVRFPVMGREITKRAYRLLLHDKEQVRSIWKSLNVTDAAMKELWPKWIRQAIIALRQESFGNIYIAHTQLFDDLGL